MPPENNLSPNKDERNKTDELEQTVNKILDEPDADIDLFLTNLKSGKEFDANTILPENSALRKENADIDANSGLVTVSEDYIKNAPENEREALEGIKGSRIDAKALKNYVNAQIYIKEHKANEIKPSDDKNNGKATPDIKATLNLSEDQQAEINKTKQAMVYSELKKRFPELPDEAETDVDILEDYVSTLRPLSQQNFMKVYESALVNADKEITSFVDLTQNWETYALNKISSDVLKFKEHITKLGITEKDLGIDLTVPKGVSDASDNPYLNKIIFPSEKTVNAKIVKFKTGIPVIIEGELFNQLRDSNYDAIIKIIQDRGVSQGYQQKVTDDVNPSQAISGLAGEDSKKIIDASLQVTDDDDLDAIDAKLAKLKGNMLGNK